MTINAETHNEKIVRDICREVFEDPSLEISSEMTARDIVGWDSFSHVQLIVQLEEKFTISFEWDEISQIESYAKLISLLRQKGVHISL